MPTSRSTLCVFALSAVTVVVPGCGLPQTSLDGGAALQQRAAQHSTRGSESDLMYSGVKHYVQIYTFPDGSLQSTSSISGSVKGMCSDSTGNVFVTAAPAKTSKSTSGSIYEYAHGGKTPVATLSLPKNEIPIACSSDPASGNLAVTAENARNFAPSIAVYANARGTPTVYRSDALGANPQAAYDDSGNLFATSGGNVGAELAKGKSAFDTITLAQTLGGVGHVQWDGTYWALQSFSTSRHNGEKLFERIYRVRISGAHGQIAGTVRFDGWPEKDPGQSWIEGGTIVATPYSHIAFWAYPAGGEPLKTVHCPLGVKAITVSASS